jgi:hypothetical protein
MRIRLTATEAQYLLDKINHDSDTMVQIWSAVRRDMLDSVLRKKLSTPNGTETLSSHIETERERHGLTPREIGFIARAWKAAQASEDNGS